MEEAPIVLVLTTNCLVIAIIWLTAWIQGFCALTVSTTKDCQIVFRCQAMMFMVLYQLSVRVAHVLDWLLATASGS